MSNMMAVFLNGIAQLEYNRDQLLPDHQAAYMEKMDSMNPHVPTGHKILSLARLPIPPLRRDLLAEANRQ